MKPEDTSNLAIRVGRAARPGGCARPAGATCIEHLRPTARRRQGDGDHQCMALDRGPPAAACAARLLLPGGGGRPAVSSATSSPTAATCRRSTSSRLHVLPSFQRRGIGSALLAAAIARHLRAEVGPARKEQADNPEGPRLPSPRGFRSRRRAPGRRDPAHPDGEAALAAALAPPPCAHLSPSL